MSSRFSKTSFFSIYLQSLQFYVNLGSSSYLNASCVRTYLLNHHKAMNSSFRQYIKDTPYVQNYKYVDFFYNMHVEAYKSCCCSGKPAPYITWMAVFYASAVIPCNYIPVLPSQTTEIGQILTYGRCGCGW
jgi:hypothetical protein